MVMLFTSIHIFFLTDKAKTYKMAQKPYSEKVGGVFFVLDTN